MLKRKSKRVLSIVLAVAMIVGLFPIAAFAEEGGNPATPVDQNTESVATKLPDADEDGVITLTEDVTMDTVVSVQSANTIDLNGHTLSVLRLDSYTDLTIRDTSNATNGVLTSSGDITCVVWGGTL